MMKRKFRREVESHFERQRHSTRKSPVSEQDIDQLPEPVQRFLRYSEVTDHEGINSVRLKQKGFIRMNPNQKWMALQAEEYYTIYPPAFFWYCHVSIAPLVSFEAVDKFANGNGKMTAKLLSLIKVVDASGDEMDQGAMLRFFNEMMWFPTALVSEYVSWESVDSGTARGTFSYGGKSVSADFYFDDQGRIVNFVAERYRSVGETFELRKWSTPVEGHAEMSGLILPRSGEAIWHLDSGEFSYIKLEITDVQYNQPKGYWQDKT